MSDAPLTAQSEAMLALDKEHEWASDHEWVPCCCQRSDDGHCWLCGHRRAGHRAPGRPWSTPQPQEVA